MADKDPKKQGNEPYISEHLQPGGKAGSSFKGMKKGFQYTKKSRKNLAHPDIEIGEKIVSKTK